MPNKQQQLEAKARQMIKSEYVIWLSTVDSEGAPQPRPVWFIWEKNTFLIFSQAKAHKIQHIQHNQNVALNFNTDPTGDQNVVVYHGIAKLDPATPPANRVRAYMKKYKAGIEAMGFTVEQFVKEYSVAIRVEPTGLRGW